MRRLLFVLGLAIFVASCGGSSRPRPSPSEQPITGKPFAVSTAAATPNVEPTVAGGDCFKLVADERAPFAQAVSYVGGLDAYLLGSTGSRRGAFHCAYVARTTDGGQTWEHLPASDLFLPSGEPVADAGTVSGIAFATPQDGWLYGPGRWATHDGGLTWQEESPGFVVNSVVASGNDGWALETVACGADSCARISVASAANNWRWTPLSAQPPAVPGLEPVKMLRPTGRRTLISFIDRRKPYGRGVLASTDDGGATWAVSSTLPSGRGDITDIEAFGENGVWVTYGSQPATIMQGKDIYHSADGGSTWTLIADAGIAWDPGRLNNLPTSGYIPRITAPSQSTLFLSMGRSTVFGSFDAGQTWSPVVDDEAARGGAASVRVLGFGDELHGFAAGSSTPWVTVDGGLTWSRVSLPR